MISGAGLPAGSSPVGRSSRTVSMTPWPTRCWAIFQLASSSSGAAAIRTRAPERSTRCRTCSLDRLPLIGAAMPASWAASVAVISSTQLGEISATGLFRCMPTSRNKFAVLRTSASNCPNVRRAGSCQRAPSGNTVTAGRSGHRVAARSSSAYVESGRPRSAKGIDSISARSSGLAYRGHSRSVLIM